MRIARCISEATRDKAHARASTHTYARTQSLHSYAFAHARTQNVIFMYFARQQWFVNTPQCSFIRISPLLFNVPTRLSCFLKSQCMSEGKEYYVHRLASSFSLNVGFSPLFMQFKDLTVQFEKYLQCFASFPKYLNRCWNSRPVCKLLK